MSRYFTCSEKTLKMQICIGDTRYYLTPVVVFFTRCKRNNILTHLEGFLSLLLCKYVELQVGADVWAVCVCGCSDIEGGAQRNLKARFGFSRLQGKRKSRW